MKKKYSSSLPALKELFPDWTEDDLVFALEDAGGDLESAIERITEGNVSQWGEVKKKTTDRSRSKAKEAQSTPTETTTASVRGGRGRGGFEGRGRARGGRGGRGGRAGAHVNGTRPVKVAATPTVGVAETPVDATPESGATTQEEKHTDRETAGVSGTGDASKEPPRTSVAPEAPKKWTSLFAKPTPPPQKKPPTATPAPAPEKAAEPAVEQKAPEPAPVPVPVPAPAPEPAKKTPEQPVPPAEDTTEAQPSEETKEPADDLTETNLERIPDASAPAPTATAASTIGSTAQDAAASATTPTRQPPSTYPSSTLKQSFRASGLQRRVMEQQEAVVMPANHAVDRAAVQFGSMGLNGDPTDVDIDENREQAETRAQPPQHSPVAPRASLPPSTQAPIPTETPAVSRPAPGLPPVPQATAAETLNDFGQYADSHKPYDLFAHQVTQPQPQAQEPFANQAPIQPTVTTSSEFSPFYAIDQQRLPYNYYGTYGQAQDATAAQRAATGFGISGAEVQPHIPTTQPPTRYGQVDTPNSGHVTPNPTLPAVTQTPTAQHIPGQAHGAYGYGYPYYSNPHYASYMSQMTQHQYGRNRPMYDDARRYDDHYMPHTSQYGYGNGYGPYGKAGMYGQPQHAFSYEHSSPANAAGFNQGVPGRDSVYGRTGSAQPSENQQTATTGTSAFGSGMSDVFGRTPAGFSQNQPISQQQPATTEEATKSFDASKPSGPSPSLAQANRPGSATNNAPGQPQAQTGLPPLQSQGQQAFGVYPHLNPQYGGLGSLGGHQAAATQTHHGTGYGNYGAAGFGNYYGNSGRGGWGGNYGH